ncbi:unnamed protein product [Protopolystoma xenopodis]|uniref:Uncharacterized protein n=1 Tax=Protopolystoma xenopodis TaxID=117903 RepID=A0A3S5C3B0_9PLAT|nr:unnamed protein product [Protopolystoma xenopodis]
MQHQRSDSPALSPHKASPLNQPKRGTKSRQEYFKSETSSTVDSATLLPLRRRYPATECCLLALTPHLSIV